MNYNKFLSLWGMPGSGKTTLGKFLAEKFSVPFFDLDEIVFQSTGKTPASWINEEGEEVFREKEHEALRFFIGNYASEKCILALGGGTVLLAQNIEILRKHSVSVFLECSEQTLVERIQKNLSDRPLLMKGNSSLKERLHELMVQRRVYYEKAEYRWRNDKALDAKSPKEIIKFFERIYFREGIVSEE